MLDTYVLDESPASKIIVENNWFGRCHLVCLSDSQAGRLWADLRIRNAVENRQFGFAEQIGQLAVYKSHGPRGGSILLSSTTGWFEYLTLEVYRSIIKEENCVLFPINIGMRLNADLGQECSRNLTDILAMKGGCSLLDAYERVGSPHAIGWFAKMHSEDSRLELDPAYGPPLIDDGNLDCAIDFRGMISAPIV